MAYFLKTSHYKKGDYIQIYESFRDPVSHQPRNRCVETLGYISDLTSDQMPDPVAHYKKKIASMNDELKMKRQLQKQAKISNVSAIRHFGWFPLNAIMNRLEVLPLIGLLAAKRSFRFSVAGLFKALVYARAIKPCSKHKTAEEVLPQLWDAPDVSYDQILSCLEFLGEQYEKVVELLTFQTGETYELDTSHVYFDCTNFYFEIDREDDWRKKGPSKENRKDPILGMGLLLDTNCIPVGMKLYPGNQSEKPVIRNIIRDLKNRGNIKGRTIQVADKGLNCARNILEAVDQGDGYLFSKSVKMLSEKEKKWVFSDEGWKSKLDPEGDLKYKYKSCIDQFEYSYVDESGRKYKQSVTEKRVVTFNPDLAKKQRHELEKMADKCRNMCYCQAKKKDFGENARYVDFLEEDKETGEYKKKAVPVFNEEKLDHDLAECGYNMLITSEIKLDPEEIYATYHQLWRIEETFRALKSELDARPVYLQNIDRIKGHFLICYTSILLVRLFQFKTLDNQFGTEKIFDFMKDLDVVEIDKRTVLNLAKNSELAEYMADKYKLPITNCRILKSQLKKVLERSF